MKNTKKTPSYTMIMPAITVVMPVYNAENFIAEAISSILNQSFTNFELLIINDCSTDQSAAIIDKYRLIDSRIRVLKNSMNRGVAYSLNYGLQEAQAELIARMDADDVSTPYRLELQERYLREHPNVCVCGGHIEDYKTGLVYKRPLSDSAIRAMLFFEAPLYHPTVLFRKSMILQINGYDSSLVPAEDYDLWEGISTLSNGFFANLDCILLRYRMNSNINKKNYYKNQLIKKNTNRIKAFM